MVDIVLFFQVLFVMPTRYVSRWYLVAEYRPGISQDKRGALSSVTWTRRFYSEMLVYIRGWGFFGSMLFYVLTS